MTPSRALSPDLALRRLLLAVLALGMAGALTELILLGHYEEPMQWVPLVMLGSGLLASLGVALRPGRPTLELFRTLMALFVLAGLLGLSQHYRGNVEFEKEMYPSMEGFELFREAMTGATPALAPGTMVLLGLVGLTYCFRHPMLGASSDVDA